MDINESASADETPSRLEDAQAHLDRVRAAYDAKWRELEASDKDTAVKAREWMRMNALSASMRLTTLALYSHNEAIALKAAQYVLDHTAYDTKGNSVAEELSATMAEFYRAPGGAESDTQ